MIVILLFGVIWILTVYSPIPVQPLQSELNFERIELLNSSYVEGLYNVSLLRISKYNRTTYALSFDGELLFDVTEDVKVKADFYHSRMNNNQYSKYKNKYKT